MLGGINTYAYVDGDPVSFSDPEGLEPLRSPVLRCIVCGALHGGLFGPYCPDWNSKSNDTSNGVPPLWTPPPPPKNVASRFLVEGQLIAEVCN